MFCATDVIQKVVGILHVRRYIFYCWLQSTNFEMLVLWYPIEQTAGLPGCRFHLFSVTYEILVFPGQYVTFQFKTERPK